MQELSYLVQRVEVALALPSDTSRILTLEDMKIDQAESCIKEYEDAGALVYRSYSYEAVVGPELKHEISTGEIARNTFKRRFVKNSTSCHRSDHKTLNSLHTTSLIKNSSQTSTFLTSPTESPKPCMAALHL